MSKILLPKRIEKNGNISQWLTTSWHWLVPWILFTGALAAWVRNMYAAERDRKALSHMKLEKEKLQLEVARLKNPPEAISERRVIYERLRALVRETLVSGGTVQRVMALQAIQHDADFCFPSEIRQSLVGLAVNTITVQVTEEEMKLGPALVGNERWPKLVDKWGAARIEIAGFESGMVDLFKPYLQRAA